MTVSLWGMGVVFFVLALLSAVILVLGRLDRLFEAAVDATAASDGTAAPASSATPDSITPEIVAVIGAALALAQGDVSTAPQRAVGAANGGPVRSSWHSAGLSRQMASRTGGSIRRHR